MKKKIYRVLVFILLSVFALSLCACADKEPEYSCVLDCAKELKEMMKDPDSFSVYGTCGYGENSDGWKLVVLPYRANSYGGYVTDIAYFVDGSYMGDKSDYTSGAYKQWDWTKGLMFQVARNVRVRNEFLKTYDPEKIMNDLG